MTLLEAAGGRAGSKAQVPRMSSPSPQPRAPGHGLPGSAVHSISGGLGRQQDWLHQTKPLAIFKKKVTAFFHEGNHMGSQDLTEPGVILTASSLRGRGRVETSPWSGEGPGFEGHLCVR